MKIALMLFSIAIILLSGVMPLQRVEGVALTVDASRRLGPVPALLSSNMWIVKTGDRNRYQIEKFFKDNQPKIIQFTLDVDFLAHTKSFEAYKAKLEEFFHPAGTPYLIVQKAKEANTTLIVGFDPYAIPSWLSARAQDQRGAFAYETWWKIERVSPPRDYTLWGKVVKSMLTFLREKLDVRRLGFYVGHEPNYIWLGDEESLFKYYEYAAKAAKEVSADILVGGIGSVALEARKASCDDEHYTKVVRELCIQDNNWADPKGEPLTKNFIEYVALHKVPIDFINWHSFGNFPTEFREDAAKVKQWLQEAGLQEEIALYPSDWTYWAEDYPADYLDTEESAAFVVSALYNMWKAGIHWHGHDFNIEVSGYEQKKRQERRNTEFIGDWPIFTRIGVVKPVYNAFQALSFTTRSNGEAAAQMLEVQIPPEDTLTALSTIKDDGVYLLVSNFVPQHGKKFPSYVTELVLKEVAFIAEEVQLIRRCAAQRERAERKEALLACKEQVVAGLKDSEKIEAIEFLASSYICARKDPSTSGVLSCLDKASSSLRNRELKKKIQPLSHFLHEIITQRRLKIDFVNLPFAVTSLATTYTIDSTHSNACRLNKRTEPSPTNTPCGIGGKVDVAAWGLLKKGKELLERAKKHKDKITTERKKNVYERYKAMVDEINNWEDISLERSKATRPVHISGTSHSVEIDIYPNSVALIILEKKR